MKKLLLKMWNWIWNLWIKFPQALRFLLVGGFNFVVSYIMFIGFIVVLGELKYHLALALSWLCSSVISFSTQKIFVFCTQGNWLREYIKCCMTWMMGYFINASLLELSVRMLHLHIYIEQIIAISITTICTYILFKNFAFRGEKQ